MGKQLFNNFSVCRKEMLQLERIAHALGFPQMLPVIEADEGRDIGEFLPAAVQLASICMQIALCRLWASWGIVPDAVVGHSLGEYAALNAAGVLSDADTLYLVGKRAELLQERCTCDTHAMLVIRASVAQIESVEGDVTKHKVEFACINSPVETVLAGTKDAITESAAILTGASLKATLLKVPYAFHSAQLDPMLSELEQVAKYVRFSKPTVPVLCPVDGSLVKDVGVFGPQYMVRHSREPVNMLQALSAARNNNVVTDLAAMLEIGPHPAIGAMIRAVLGSHVPTLASCQRGRSTWHVLTASLKHMYTAGADIRWLEYHRDFKSSHKVISLPLYNWDMTDYWIPYLHDWSLRKGDPPLIINSGGGPRLDTTTIHRVVQETPCSADQLRVVVEADIQRPDLSPVVQGHEVDGIPLCTPSVYADISLTLGTYLVQRYRPSQAGNLVDVTDMTITKALILRAGQKQQLLQGHAHVDWSTNSAVVVFMSFDPIQNKQKLQEHSRCPLRFKDGPPLQKSLQKGVSRVTQRLQALRDGVGHGTTARYNRAMAYRAIRPLARFHPDYRAVDEAILDSVKLECSSHLNFTTLKKGGKFHTHPAVIDALTQSCGFTMNCNDSADLDEDIYMNHGWGSLQLFEDIDLQKSYRTYTLMKEGIDNMYHGDVVVLDNHDKVVAFFGQITIQRVPRRVLKVILTIESGAKSQRQVTTSRSEIATMKTPTSDPAKPIIRHSSSAAAVPDPVSAKEDAAARSSPASGGSQTPSGLARALSIIAEESGLAVTDLTDGTVLADAGIDSLLALTISARFKEELDVDLDFNALFIEYPTVGELKTFVGKVTCSTVSSAETSNPTSGAAEYADTIVSSSASMAGGSLEKHQDGPLAQKVDVNRALQIISEEGGVAMEDLTNDTVFSDAGVDSLLSLVITSRFRDELGLGIQLESLLLECPTVGELKAYLLGGDSDTTQAATQSSSPFLVAAASLPTTDTKVSEIRSDLPPRSQEESSALTARQNAVDRLVRKYTSGFSAPQSVPSSSAPTEEGTVVLVTGATGSLGSHLAYMLAQRADLKRVVCLNRENRGDAYTRQVKTMREKGIRFPETLKPKLLVLQAYTSKPMLGLERNTYGNLVDSITHIIHNAWPMSGQRALDRFEPQFQVMQNLIQLSSDIASRRLSSFKVSFQMVSSIGVVGLYGLQDSKEHKDKTKPTVVPEARLGIDSTDVVAGSKSHGYWNPMEHISFLVKLSQTVKALPNLGGTVRWTPAEDVAGTLIDLVLSDQKRDPHPFYHIDHPVGQPWAHVNAILADKKLI
ncbi:beta-ketoacyl synthase domain-containing protein, partial [Metarhizium brunneum ARSEF 3297]